jgi:DNA-binding NarL/FixJ family response regulator
VIHSLKPKPKNVRKSAPPAVSAAFKLAVVEDDLAIRTLLTRVFAQIPDLRLGAVCADAPAALRELPPLAPDVVLMDIDLPGLSGIDCLRFLKALLPKVRVLIFTGFGTDEYLFRSLQAGADGFLLKPVSPPNLVAALREILGGGSVLCPTMARRMIDHFQHSGTSAAPADAKSAARPLTELTARELEVLEKLAEGASVKEVSTALHISWQTVRTHIASTYDKLHVHSRTEAVLKFLGQAPR